jgi:S1-C subfamily serine protease
MHSHQNPFVESSGDQTAQAPHRASCAWSSSFRRLVTRTTAPLLALGATFALLVSPAAAGAATTSDLPAPSSSQLVSMFASPATLLVAERTQFDFAVYEPVLDVDRLIVFANTDPTITNAVNTQDYASASADILAELEAHPTTYLSAGAKQDVGYDSIDQGTGWAVTSDGYIVTNHHVVDFDQADARHDIGMNGDGSPTSTSVSAANQIESQLEGITWGATPLSIGNTASSDLDKLATSWVMDRSKLVTFHQSISVGGGQSVNAVQPTSKMSGYGARIVKTSNGEWPSQDVAVLKIHAENLPVIPLGDDSTLQVGDSVHAVGYPASASFSSDVNSDPSSTVTATVTSGQVTNRIPEQGGFEAIENTAVINQGNSGGPLLDSEGRAIGIVTAGTRDAGGAFFYAEPISVVEEYLRAAGVPLNGGTVSPDQVTFDNAMQLMQQSHYKAAMNDLMQVQADGFNTPYVMMHTQMVQQAINHGEDVPVGHFPIPTWVMVASAALLLGAVGVGRHRKQVAQLGTALGDPAQAIPHTAPEATSAGNEARRGGSASERSARKLGTDSKDPVAQLRQLMELKGSGIISSQDFEQKKGDILSRM